MEKIALITDTTADLNDEIIRKYNIHVLPFRIIYKNKEYKDRIDITPKQVYDNLNKEVPTSSLPCISDIEKVFAYLEKEGYTHIIVITLSTGLSGIYNAIKLIAKNYSKMITYICDSKSISVGEGFLVETCGKFIKEGKSFEEIVNMIPFVKSKMHLFFVVGTLEYLRKGGRIGRVSGTIGKLLNIKPIISINNIDGKYYTFDKVRGRKQSLNKLVNIARRILEKSKCKVYVLHGSALEESKKVYEALSKLHNVVSTTFGGEISPVSGVHSGPGLVGMLLVEEF